MVVNQTLTLNYQDPDGLALLSNQRWPKALHGFGSTMAEMEQEHILETLACCDGNCTQAARPMTVCDDLAAMDSAAETFVSKTTFSLRKAGNGDSGELWSTVEPAPVPHQPGTNLLSANDAAGDQRVRELRGVENVVAATRARHKIDLEEPAPVLRQRRPGAGERAEDRVDEAVSYLIRTLSNEADLKRHWDRTDEALADLLFALSKQASYGLRAERTAAKRLRLAQDIVKAERELRAIRQFRKSRRWRTLVHG